MFFQPKVAACDKNLPQEQSLQYLQLDTHPEYLQVSHFSLASRLFSCLLLACFFANSCFCHRGVRRIPLLGADSNSWWPTALSCFDAENDNAAHGWAVRGGKPTPYGTDLGQTGGRSEHQ